MDFTEAQTVETKGQAGAPSPGEGPAKNGRRRWIAFIVLLAALVVGGVYGGRRYLRSLNWESTDDAAIEGHVVAISTKVAGQVIEVKITDNQLVREGQELVIIDPADYRAKLDAATAALSAAKAKKLAAMANVMLVEITATAGVDQAQSGLEVAEASVKAAETQVDTAKSQLEQAKAQVAAALAAVAQAQADVKVAESDAERADTEMKRYDAVRETAAVSRQQIDLIESNQRSAHAKLSAAKEKVTAMQSQAAAAKATEAVASQSITQAQTALEQAKAKLGEARAKLRSAKSGKEQMEISKAQAAGADAEIALAEAQVRQAELQLSYTSIRAPRAGRITRKSVEKGAYVQAGQSLSAIVSDEVWVVANFKETQLRQMRPGQKAEIRVDTYRGDVFEGHVDSIQSGTGARFSLLPPENATGNFVKIVQRVPVKIVFEKKDEDRLLVPGMSVIAEVKVK